MRKRKYAYTRAIVIVHGKSELQIVEHIKSNLRISIIPYSEKKGEKSIQINGLKNNVLGNTIFKDIDSFIRTYEKVEVIGKGKKRKLNNFKLFIIMDTDDCSEEEKQNFINKKMFKNHWMYDYIEPIYNISNLECVLKRCNIKYNKVEVKKIRDKDLKSCYVKIFPTDKKYIDDDIKQLISIRDALKKSELSNLDEFIDYCLKVEEERKLT